MQWMNDLCNSSWVNVYFSFKRIRSTVRPFLKVSKVQVFKIELSNNSLDSNEWVVNEIKDSSEAQTNKRYFSLKRNLTIKLVAKVHPPTLLVNIQTSSLSLALFDGNVMRNFQIVEHQSYLRKKKSCMWVEFWNRAKKWLRVFLSFVLRALCTHQFTLGMS